MFVLAPNRSTIHAISTPEASSTVVLYAPAQVSKQDIGFLGKTLVNALCDEVFQRYTGIKTSLKQSQPVDLFWNNVE